MKIILLGNSGAGKTYVSNKLAASLHLPIFHFDNAFFDLSKPMSRGQSCKRDEDEAAEMVSRFLEQNPYGWVIDGGLFHLGLDSCCRLADKIVIFRINRFVRLFRVLKRIAQNPSTGKKLLSRNGIAHIFRAIKWTLYSGTTKKYNARYDKVFNDYKDKTTVIRTVRGQKKYMEEMTLT